MTVGLNAHIWAGLELAISLHVSSFPIFQQMEFYFAHSYKFCPENSNIVTSTFDHGQPITSSIEHENIFGVQFHPEKSHIFGMRLFKNFSKI